MDSLRIDGAVRLMINDDPDRVISFNPSDVLFAEKFYQLIKEFEAKEALYREQAAVIDENKAVDDLGIPENAPEGLALLRGVCDFMRDKIDDLFGEGTSQNAFGDYRSLEMIEQFFDGIIPHIEKRRQAKLSKYAKKKRGSGKVMQ